MRKNLPLIAALLALPFIGAGCLGLGAKPIQIKPVTIEYWRIEDEPEMLAPVIEAYRKIHPNVTINYQKFRKEDYQRKLLEAFAEDRGPDLFSLPNVWLRGWQSKIQPMPKETVIPTQTVDAQKKIVTVNKKTPTMTIRDLNNSYVEQVPKDVLLWDVSEDPRIKPEQKIFGLPYSMDTLGLFYNEDLLTKASIEKPPETWRTLQDQSKSMTITEGDGETLSIKQSGAAIGMANNVAHSTEILAILMEQNGAIMSDDNGYATFSNFPAGKPVETAYPPGVEALQFYTSFAAKGAPNFSWSADMPNSLDAFVSGKTAFYFGYPSEITEIRTRSPKLNFGITKVPQVQPSTPHNIAYYPIEVVSKKTKNPNEVWDFLQFAASREQVTGFLTAAKRPTALRALISDQLTNADIAPFAGQLLTAKSWYRGTDYEKVEAAFKDMINTKPTFEHPEWLPIVAQAAGVVNTTIPFR